MVNQRVGGAVKCGLWGVGMLLCLVLALMNYQDGQLLAAGMFLVAWFLAFSRFLDAVYDAW